MFLTGNGQTSVIQGGARPALQQALWERAWQPSPGLARAFAQGAGRQRTCRQNRPT